MLKRDRRQRCAQKVLVFRREKLTGRMRIHIGDSEMRKAIGTVVAFLTLTVAAVAQDVEGRLDDGRGPGRRGHGPPIHRIIERLTEQLDLDDEQTARIEELVAAHEQGMQEVFAQREEIRAAMQAGDEERVAELREELRQEWGGPGAAIQALLDEIEPVLREDQLETFQQFRENIAPGPGPGGWGRMRRMVEGLPDAVNMTEEQRKKFAELLAQGRDKMGERMRERWPRGQEGGPDEAEHPGRPDFSAMENEFFDQVSEILEKDQLDLLAAYRAGSESGRGARERREADDLRIVVSAADRLQGLSSEQKEEWTEIKGEAMRSYRDLRRTDKEGRAALAADVKARILKLLDEEQTTEFERNIERLKAHSSRSARDRRAGRVDAGEEALKRPAEANADDGDTDDRPTDEDE